MFVFPSKNWFSINIEEKKYFEILLAPVSRFETNMFSFAKTYKCVKPILFGLH